MKGDPTRCPLISVEAVDEEENPITDLIASLQDNLIKPIDPNLTKVYNFTLKATVGGGNYIITTNKTFIVNKTKSVNSIDDGSESGNYGLNGSEQEVVVEPAITKWA